METYRTRGVCATFIEYEVADGKVKNIRFIGGCRGNQQGVARLAEGRPVDEVIALLRGVQCRGGTSCPDQLAQALLQYKEKNR